MTLLTFFPLPLTLVVAHTLTRSALSPTGIYGVVVGALIATNLKGAPEYKLFTGFLHMGAGLSVGLSGLAAGFAIGVVGDAGVRGTAQQPRLFVGMVLILIFAEVLGLYGLIVSLILIGKASS